MMSMVIEPPPKLCPAYMTGMDVSRNDVHSTSSDGTLSDCGWRGRGDALFSNLLRESKVPLELSYCSVSCVHSSRLPF